MSQRNHESPTPKDVQQQEEGGRRFHTSVLFDRHVNWVVVALLVIFIWYQLIPLIILSSFFLIVSAVISFWKKYSLHNVSVALELSQQRIFAENEIKITATLHNQKWLPLVWAEFELEEHRQIIWAPKNPYRIRFLWLLWHQKVNWTITGSVQRRGVYQLGRYCLRSGDGFRFTETEQKGDLPLLLYVYPKLIPVVVPSLTAFTQWGVNGKNGGYLVDPQLIQSIRDYQAGDEWRSVHWQASARAGKLQTKVYQPVFIRQLTIFMDVSGFDKENEEEAFEQFVAIIASTAVAYLEQGIKVGLITNALDYNGKPSNSLSAVSSISAVLDQLAAVTSASTVSQESKRKELIHAAGPVYYFCRQLTDDHLRWWNASDKAGSFVRFYYQEESHATAGLKGLAQPIQILVGSKGHRP